MEWVLWVSLVVVGGGYSLWSIFHGEDTARDRRFRGLLVHRAFMSPTRLMVALGLGLGLPLAETLTPLNWIGLVLALIGTAGQAASFVSFQRQNKIWQRRHTPMVPFVGPGA